MKSIKKQEMTPPPTPEKALSIPREGNKLPAKRKRQAEKSGRKSWTEEDGKLIKKLREEDKLGWAEIARYFPGKRPQTIEKAAERLRGRYEDFSEEEKMQLKSAIDEQTKHFWSGVGAKIGKSGKVCERIAKQELKLKITI